MRIKRVVVTGGRGFLGRHVVRAARGAGYDVRSCSRSESVDLRDPAVVGEYLSEVAPDVVVHCAAHVGGIGYVGRHAIDVFQDNLAIGAGLLRGVHAAGVNALITIMPNCTYPGAKDIYREDEWWDGPIDDSVLMYGLPRKTLWGLCKTYGDASDLRSAHLVFPNMYGPGDHFDPIRSHALGALVKKITEADRNGHGEVEIWGSGRPVREWMHVEDSARAIVAFLGTARRNDAVLDGHQLYNVGTGRGVSIAELARMIAEAVGWDGSFVFDASRPDGAMQKLIDGTRFQGVTNWKPRVELLDGVRATVAWYAEQFEREPAHAC